MPAAQFMNFVFTLNNPVIPADHDLLKELVQSGKAVFITYQLEAGKEGTPHFQGYVEWTTKKSFAACKKLLTARAHIEARMGTQDQAIAYANKLDTRVEGPWTYGEKKTQAKVSCSFCLGDMSPPDYCTCSNRSCCSLWWCNRC